MEWLKQEDNWHQSRVSMWHPLLRRVYVSKRLEKILELVAQVV